MREFGAFDAKDRFGALPDLVEQGEEIVVTRQGKAVALLVPARPNAGPEEARAAAQGIRDMSRGVTLGGLAIKDLVDEGRA